MTFVRVWPSGGPLSLPSLVVQEAVHVLLLPVAGVECVISDDVAMTAEVRTRALVRNHAPPGTVVSWSITNCGDSVAVLVHAALTDTAPIPIEAQTIFERACETQNFDLSPRDCIFTVDELRALLWCIVSRPKPFDEVGTSRFSLLRGFERLQAVSAKTFYQDDEEMNVESVSTSENISKSDRSEEKDPYEEDEHNGYTTTSNKMMIPCLSLPSLPVFPVSPQLRSPAASPLLKRQQSLRPLNLGQLNLGESEISTTHEEFRVATKVLSKIRDYLYVGGETSASLGGHTLRKHNIVTVVNLAAGAIVNGTNVKGVKVVRVYARDSETEDASALFPIVGLAVSKARRRNSAVLIHCHRGVSRSCAMAAAVLMLEEKPDAAWALAEVRNARPVASPNPAFVRALQSLQMALHGESSKRIAVLSRLKGDPGDGAEVLVDMEKSSAPFNERAWAPLIVEEANNAGVLAARGPLCHEWRWKQALEIANWIVHRNGLFCSDSSDEGNNTIDMCRFNDNIAENLLRNR